MIMSLYTEVSNIQEALEQLGVTGNTLTEEEKRALDDNGYIVFPSLMPQEWLEGLQAKYEQLMQQEGRSAGSEVHQEEGTRRLSDLVNKGAEFDGIYTHPKVLAAVYHIISRDFKLSSLNGRDAVPGHGHQGLHADWGSRFAGEPYHVVNSVWMLDDFSAENGATRVVPGTHKLAGDISALIPNPAEAHPDQIVLQAPAGSVAVFNSHLWHGGTRNTSTRTRRGIFGYFTAREFGQQLDQSEYIRVKTYRRLSPAARYVLGVE